MVYCGRPSASCSNCRLKKRRCDKAIPGCGQCRRTGQECPGYRDLSSLTFRDESSRVIDKARSRDAKRAAAAAAAAVTTARPVQRPSSQNSNRQTLTDAPVPEVENTPELCINNEDTMFNIDELHLACLGFQDAFSMDGSLPPMPSEASISVPIPSYDITLDIPDRSPRNSLSAGQLYVSGKQNDEVKEGSSEDGSEKGDSRDEDQFSMARPFSLPLDMIGLNFFLSNYVIRQTAPTSGFLDYIFPILAREDGHELLEGAILALGFAGLAHTMRQGDLMSRSMMMYNRTMKQINIALADPVSARRNGTMVTVLVLALYEFSRASLRDWTHHIQGASTLLALRGKSQFGSEIGAQIFEDVFSFILTNCLLTGSAVPPGLRMLRMDALNTARASNVQWVVNNSMIELVDLYQQLAPNGYNMLAKGTMPGGSEPMAPRLAELPLEGAERFLSQALEIDHRLERCFAECGPEWQYRVVPSTPQDAMMVLGDSYHVYPDICIASVWNNMRVARILANHAIASLLLRGASVDSNWFFSNQYVDRLQQVTQFIGQVRNDIIASIPQLLGHVPGPNQQSQVSTKSTTPVGSDSGIDINDASSTPSSISHTSPFRFDQITYNGSAISGYLASWVLLMIGCMHSLGDDKRAWTVAQLRRVSSLAGLAQADDFAHCVETDKLRPPLS